MIKLEKMKNERIFAKVKNRQTDKNKFISGKYKRQRTILKKNKQYVWEYDVTSAAGFYFFASISIMIIALVIYAFSG